MERLTLLFLTIRVVPAIKPRPQFWITQYLIRLVNPRHFFLRFLFRDSLLGGFVRMVLFRHIPIGALDGTVIGVGRNFKDFVVIFRFGAFEEGVGFLEEGLDLGSGGMVLFGQIETLDAGFEVVGLELPVGLGKKGG